MFNKIVIFKFDLNSIKGFFYIRTVKTYFLYFI